MYSHSPLLQALAKHAALQPDKTAIIVGNQEVKYSELLTNVHKSASYLFDKGLSKGQTIVLSAHKDIKFVYLYFGAQVLGITNVIVDSENNEERLRYIEKKTSPSYCFGYNSPIVESILLNDVNFDSYKPYISQDKTLCQDDIAEILFTTGTTGAPKGVCLSYFNIYSSADNINGFVQNKPEEIEIIGLPICHSFGLGRIRCNILLGATIVLLGNFANVRQFFKAIEVYNATGFGLVPAAWAYIRKVSGKRIEKYASRIKYIEIGSAAMSLETKREICEIFPNTRICMHYGLTEASRICFVEFHDAEHLDTIGKPVCEKVDVKILNTDGKEVAVGEKGELCVKGNMVMLRYFEDRDMVNSFYGEYFKTGDCGYISEEGYVYLLGREKELINVGGKKVSPMEIEDAICALGVGDCICIAKADPRGIMGEVVKCYVLKGSTTLTFEQISEQLKEKLEHYKLPVEYDWIETIPQTSSGKKQRVNLK